MPPLDLLAASPAAFVAVTFVLGLLVGSFLNVVSLRLPRRLEWQWRRQCRDILSQEPEAPEPEPPGIVRPRSRCVHCGHAIPAWENIPVLSFLLLRGRCSKCGQRISWQYPAVELGTALLTVVVAWHFGSSIQAAAALLFTWSLIALAVIDTRDTLLPDDITLPLLWTGLILSLAEVFTDSTSAILGAVGGYLSLWLVYQVFRLVTGKEGMGYGDFKLFAAIGAWLGWSLLLPTIMLAAAVGAVVGTGQIIILGRDRTQPIPFGPYLAAAGWIAMLWGHRILDAYWRFAGL